jgi:hypothetical protein
MMQLLKRCALALLPPLPTTYGIAHCCDASPSCVCAYFWGNDTFADVLAAIGAGSAANTALVCSLLRQLEADHNALVPFRCCGLAFIVISSLLLGIRCWHTRAHEKLDRKE